MSRFWDMEKSRRKKRRDDHRHKQARMRGDLRLVEGRIIGLKRALGKNASSPELTALKAEADRIRGQMGPGVGSIQQGQEKSR